MLKSCVLFLFLFSLVSCTRPQTVPQTATREIASAKEETKNVIKYISYKDGTPVVDAISAVRWQGSEGGFSAGGRQDFLIKFFSANTREKSNSGQRHAACFEGSATQIKNTFFNGKHRNNIVRGLIGYVPNVKVSGDGMMMGVRFQMTLPNEQKVRDYFFRLPHCLAGKAAIDENSIVEVGMIDKTKINQDFEIAEQALAEIQGRTVAAITGTNAQGFTVEDKPIVGPEMNLPKFELRADYEKSKAKEVYPWKNADVTTEKGAMQLAMVLQHYIYENMANQDPSDPNMNFVAQKNTSRYFCHTPWLNVGPAGREGIHGMTKERDLKPIPSMDVYARATPGSDWGVSFYNGAGCTTIFDVYGSITAPALKPNFNKAVFKEGTFSAKLLFTSADFPEIQDAFSWQANISEAGSNFRSIKTVRHIQMDIAVKDKTIKGTDPELNHWLMYTYYYDPNFDYDKEYKAIAGDNPLDKIVGLPKGFLKMRPMGVQVGFGVKESMIFTGAQTNGVGGRLNGPADNGKGSCLSCHGTAGMAGKGMIPGFLDNKDWSVSKLSKAKHLDFSQQFALGKRNYETVIPAPKAALPPR